MDIFDLSQTEHKVTTDNNLKNHYKSEIFAHIQIPLIGLISHSTAVAYAHEVP